ncbi:6-O-methylguanine DNA methyltransferase [Diplogelasinospora grovesii]|uniref:Methylated-DNA--protein-cysteine methyltransferase n=1 Tax=Diplogelasinospora grovesii TaxID=303347 RepID=A0AAN6N9M4_9PEZI|nr:6-O-methylguanine DNA methyltransferase [Diplogelasinospora grovesii]
MSSNSTPLHHMRRFTRAPPSTLGPEITCIGRGELPRRTSSSSSRINKRQHEHFTTSALKAMSPITTTTTALTTDTMATTTPATSGSTNIKDQLNRIQISDRTPFEKSVWSLLLQIPPGSYTTYGIIATHLRSSPRAVGNALRRNPFAPEVPCHRVVASDRSLGGFKGCHPRKHITATTTTTTSTKPCDASGDVVESLEEGGSSKGLLSWEESKEGITLQEKVTLLRGEGVRFDSKGRVLGTPFTAFM